MAPPPVPKFPNPIEMSGMGGQPYPYVNPMPEYERNEQMGMMPREQYYEGYKPFFPPNMTHGFLDE